MQRAGANYYYHADDMFNLMALTDDAGAVVERYDYDDFGYPVIMPVVRQPDQIEVFDADFDPNPDQIVELIADTFTLTEGTSLTRLRWWGGYSYGTGAPAADSFTVYIHADAGGVPGPLLYQQHLGHVQRYQTGLIVLSATGNVPEYAYNAALPEPFTAQAGETHWLVIVNDTSGHPTTWGWESTAAGDGNLAWSHNGGPWGNYPADTAFIVETASSSAGNPYLFSGRRYDVETELYYYRTRYLDPAVGRFLTRDALGIWGDPLNLGAATTYVGNNPWVNRDPHGDITVKRISFTKKPCGGVEAKWTFSLDKAAKCDGYIVQENKYKDEIAKCNKKAKKSEQHFWESWTVKKGKKQSWDTIRDKWTDMVRMPSRPNTCGEWEIRGTIKFFCVGKTGDLGDFNKKPKKPNDGWGPGAMPWSGALPSTTQKPKWWDKPSDGGEKSGTRDAGAEWDCCNKPFKNKVWVKP
jgi:RHS repeat-associated protein